MKVVEFYRNEIPNNNGNYLCEILAWNFDRLEVDHDYIQWLFPLKEKSMFNDEAPTITDEEISLFAVDNELRINALQSFLTILLFFGFKVVENEVIIQEPGEYHKDPQWVFRAFNHNMLRISRVLKSMRLIGHEDWSESFFNALKKFRNQISDNTWSYWEEAVFCDVKEKT